MFNSHSNFIKKDLSTFRSPSLSLVKFIFIPFSLLLFGISVFIGGVYISIFCFSIFTLAVIFTFNKGVISDPRMLITGFLFIYSCWYPLRVSLTGFSLLEIDYVLLKSSVNLSFLGTITFVLVTNTLINENQNIQRKKLFTKISREAIFQFSEKILFFSLLTVVALSLFYVILSGAERTLDIVGPIVQIGHFSVLLLILLTALRMSKIKEKFYFDKLVIAFLVLSILFVLVTGRREAAFRIILICIIIFFDKNERANSWIIVSLLVGAAILVPFTQAFKAVLLSGELALPSLGVRAVFSNEFISASRNLYSLMLFEVEHDVSFIFTDILRAFVPTILLPDLDLMSSTRWFNSVYRVEHGFDGEAGWGFGIIAQGYLIGGPIGIILLMSIYSSIVSGIYNIRFKNKYFYVFYLIFLITAIYCIRADLANLLSQSFKIAGLMLILVLTSHMLMKRKYFESLK